MSRSAARSLATDISDDRDVELVPVYAPRWIRPDETSSWNATTYSDGCAETMMSPSTQSRLRCPVAKIESFDGQENTDSSVREPQPGVPEREYRRPPPHSDHYAPSATESIAPSDVSSRHDSSLSTDDDPFTKRQRRRHGSVTRQRNRQSLSYDSSADSDEPFFSTGTTTIGYHSPRSDDPESWEGHNDDEYSPNMCIHQFHWTENIELGSPWVGRRTTEILNHVNGLNETPQEPETTSVNDSRDSTMDLNKVYEWCSESEDSITYEVANKICDAMIKHNNDDDGNETVVSGGQCPSSERFKWTELYRKFLNYHQLM